ncbi:hypothetical protein LIER_19139 [Lithospermum erythrorhizon]|uniref:HMA domain-containing protein n=1 Tax=Lithospermum erythrorhizon TaxID=34254 RepID=A0AAV3QHV1_LITER
MPAHASSQMEGNRGSLYLLSEMAAEKTTVMVLKVDLQCPCCYKKIKKILCKFPQIRDQVYDEKANEVTITVVCCSPEKIRDKLCSKGGKIIKSIDIKEPPKKPNNPPPQPEKPKEAPKPPPKEPEKPKEAPKPPPKEPEKPKEAPKPPIKEPEKPKEAPKPPPKELEKPKETPKPKEAPTPPPPQKTPGPPQFMPPQEMFPAHGFPQPQVVPTGCCCGPCYNGLSGGPCYYGGGSGGGYGGRPVPPPPTYDYNYGRPCYVSSCEYFSEENPQGCFIM